MAVNLDQHFMIDKNLLKEVASYADEFDVILEIGPGKGALTEELVKRARMVFAIEKDNDFMEELEEKFTGSKKVVFMFDDVLKAEFPKFTKCISNLPYSICEPLLWRLFRLEFEIAVLVVPEGFADILIGKSWSKLNYILPIFYSIKKVRTIPRDAFFPEPRVKSALVVLTPRKSDNPLRDIYLQYDKKLRNALREMVMKRDDLTKRKASLQVSTMFSKQMLDKKVLNLSAVEIKQLMEKV